MVFQRRRRATNITSMPQTRAEERAIRMRNYALTMGFRTACFISLIWVRGWWMVVLGLCAIFLPYIAVVLANAARARRPDVVEKPEPVVEERAALPARPGEVVVIDPVKEPGRAYGRGAGAGRRDDDGRSFTVGGDGSAREDREDDDPGDDRPGSSPPGGRAR